MTREECRGSLLTAHNQTVEPALIRDIGQSQAADPATVAMDIPTPAGVMPEEGADAA